MHMKRAMVASVVVVVLALAGCATNATRLNEVKIGMSKNEVLGLLGKPDSTSAQANVEYLTYYLSNEASAREQPYMVRLVDARVESFGRFIQLLDVYNRPVSGAALGLGAVMPYATNTDILTRLQQLKALKDQGVLTEEEFQRAKQRLLEMP